MVVKSKTGTAKVEFKSGPPKTTRQGFGQQSRPRRRGKKPMRGQGQG